MSEQASTPNSEGVPPSISELVRGYQARTGNSLHYASRSSARTGHTVTQRYLWDLSEGNAKAWPKSAETFSALAEALETTPLAVVLGFAVEFGIPVRMPIFATRIPPAIEGVPERVQDAIVGLTWALATDVPARRYLPDEAVPELEDTEGMLGEQATATRTSRIGDAQ